MQTINDRIGILINSLGMTKTAFGESLKVSQQYISKLIRTGTPSNLLIEDICEKYHVDENWLRTGEGEMFEVRTKNQIIVDFAGDLSKEDDTFKKRLFEALAELDERDWETLEKIAEKLTGNKKE